MLRGFFFGVFMAKRVVMAVADSASGLYGQPIFGVSIGVVQRSFADEVNRASPDNGMYAHPDDFSLVYLADFDDEGGNFTLPEGGPRVIVRGKDVSQKENA